MSKQNGFFLGIDTSNYTTSCAVCSYDGEIIANIKHPLPVADGQRGLRQSDAVFHHTVALSEVIREAEGYFEQGRLFAVGASERPRDSEGSYMPCFLPGKAAAVSASAAAGVPYFDFSHQCGHIMAALYSSGNTSCFDREFAAFHVSGGTTDIVIVKPDAEHVFNVLRIGGTLDINAGQAIDRAGVMMGLKFPCGPELERLCTEYGKTTDCAGVCVNGLSCNLSGVENLASNLYTATGDKARVSSFVIDFVSRTLEKLTVNLLDEYPGISLVYAGGVMSCSVIKKALSKYGAFAAPAFSSDNAAGIALLTRYRFMCNEQK